MIVPAVARIAPRIVIIFSHPFRKLFVCARLILFVGCWLELSYKHSILYFSLWFVKMLFSFFVCIEAIIFKASKVSGVMMPLRSRSSISGYVLTRNWQWIHIRNHCIRTHPSRCHHLCSNVQPWIHQSFHIQDKSFRKPPFVSWWVNCIRFIFRFCKNAF